MSSLPSRDAGGFQSHPSPDVDPRRLEAAPRELPAFRDQPWAGWMAGKVMRGEGTLRAGFPSALELVSLVRPFCIRLPAALGILICLLKSPPSGTNGRNSSIHTPQRQNPSSVASGILHPIPALRATLHASISPSPAGFVLQLRESHSWGRKKV